MTISRRWWAFERGTLWAMDLAGEESPASPSPHSAVGAVRFAEVQPGSAGALAATMGLPGPEFIMQRFATGRRCFAMWVEGQVAAYGWVSRTAECIGELDREFRMQPGEAYIWDCVTLPPYRRRGLYSALLRHIVAQLRREGLRRVWIGASLANRPSIRGFANAGFRPVVQITYVRLFSLCCLWRSADASAPEAWVAAAHRGLAAPHERTWGAFVFGRAGATHLPACAQVEAAR